MVPKLCVESIPGQGKTSWPKNRTGTWGRGHQDTFTRTWDSVTPGTRCMRRGNSKYRTWGREQNFFQFLQKSECSLHFVGCYSLWNKHIFHLNLTGFLQWLKIGGKLNFFENLLILSVFRSLRRGPCDIITRHPIKYNQNLAPELGKWKWSAGSF